MAHQKKKKEGYMIKKIVLAGVVVIVIALVGISFYLGAFSSVSIEKAVAGPYKIACLDHIGPYKDICKKIYSAKKLLDEQGITPGAACGVYYDDPKTTPSDKLRSKGGYLLEGDAKLEIMEKLDIPQREVVIAKVKAHPAIAFLKTYPKIDKWLIDNNYSVVGPALEVYYVDGIIEVQMPISPKQEAHEESSEAIEEKTGES